MSTYPQDVMPKKLSGRGNSSLEDLPDDVVLDILSRLPVKSLAYTKCVCKNWRNLVLKPECLLIYCYECVDIGTHPGTLKLTEIEGKHNQNRLLHDPFMDICIADLFPGSLVFVVGSVNGLICLWELGDDGEEGDNTCICNPITKEYMILPKQQFSVENYMDLSCGFGVSLTGEHKVIRILCQSNTNMIKVEVYTLGTNGWRSLEVPDNINEKHCINKGAYIPKYDHGLYLNGHVHWVFGDQILTFNLDNETFQLFPFPPHNHIETWARQILGVLKGCLCLVLGFSVWVMKEDGMQKYWHLESEIKESFNPCIHFLTWYPICLFDALNGKSILMVQICKEDEDEYEDEDEDENQDHERENKQLVAYCLETKTIEDTTIIDHFFTVRTYCPGYMKLQNFQSPTGVCIF